MKGRCESCGRALLNSDLKCYHCGAPVEGRQPSLEPLAENGSDVGSAVRLGGVVIGLMVIGALLMNWMGAGYSAELNITPTPPPPAGWRSVISPEDDYEIWLPTSWEVYTPVSRGWEEKVAEAPHPLPSLFRMAEPVDPLDRITLVARKTLNDGASPLMISVDKHPGMVQHKLISLQLSDWSDRGVLIDTTAGLNLVLRPTGDSALLAELVYPTTGGQSILYTLSMLIRTGSGVYAVTASTDEVSFLEYEETLWAILDSFRTFDILTGLDVAP